MSNDELAQKRWQSIPGDIRKKFEENVFCSECGLTTIVNYQVDSVDHDIVLKGYCEKCNEKVARVID